MKILNLSFFHKIIKNIKVKCQLAPPSLVRLKKPDQAKPLFLDFFAKEISSLRVNGSEVKGANLVWKDARINLPSELLREGKNQVEITFNNEYRELGGGLISVLDNYEEQYVYTMTKPFSSHYIYPCFDQPDIKGAYKLIIIAPEKWKAVSNDTGTILTESGGSYPEIINTEINEYTSNHPDSKVWSFKSFSKLSPHSIGFFAGNFEEIRLPPERSYKLLRCTLYCRKAALKHLKKESDEIFEIIINGIKYLEELFGSHLPWNKLDFAFLPFTQYPSLELCTCPILDESLLTSFQGDIAFQIKRAALLLQQAAHIWFGNLVTISWWNDACFDDALTLFISYLALSKITSKLPNTSPLAGCDMIWEIFNFEKEVNLIEDTLKDHKTMSNEYKNANQYVHFMDPFYQWRGAGIWRQLYYLIGEDSFKRGLKKIITENEASSVSAQVLIECFEDAINHRKQTMLMESVDKFIMTNAFDLNSFNFMKWVQDWMATPGANEIEVAWEKDNPRFNNMIKIKQSQMSSERNVLRNHRIKVALINQNGDVFKVKDVYIEKQKNTSFILEDPDRIPAALILNYEGYGYVNSVIDPSSLNFLIENIAKIKDKKLLFLIFTVLYKMTAQGKFSALRLINIITTFLAQRKKNMDAILLQKLIWISKQTTEELVPKANQIALKSKLYQTLMDYTKSEIPLALKPLVVNSLSLFAEKDEDGNQLFAFFNDYLAEEDNYEKMSLAGIYELFKKLYIVTKREEFYNKFLALPEIHANDQVAQYYKTQFKALITPKFEEIREKYNQDSISPLLVASIEGARLGCEDYMIDKWFEIVEMIILDNQDFDVKLLHNLLPKTDKLDYLMEKVSALKKTGTKDAFVENWIQYKLNELKMKKGSFTNL